MNSLTLGIFALVAFAYFGGSMVPSVVRHNKEIIVGVAVGMVACSLFGMEGFKLNDIAAPFDGGQGRQDQGRNPPS